MGNKVGTFLIGGLVGAAVALLYAPRSGYETRAMVTDKMNAAWGEAQELGAQASDKAQQVYQDATSKGQEVVHDVAAKGQQAVQDAQTKGRELYGAASARVQEAADNIKPVFSEKNDDLREKIEAARQRIAAQVAKNAEQAHDAVSDKIPVAADNAHEAVDNVADKAKEAADTATNAAESAAGKIAGDTEVPVDKGPAESKEN